MSRLASFRGPSTPTSSPVQRKTQNRSTPNSPSKQIESTYHRKLRACLLEIRAVTETWEDLVIFDGLKSLRKLVDARTDMDNELARIPNRLPCEHVVAPKLETMDQYIDDLDSMIAKLQKQFRKLNSLIEMGLWGTPLGYLVAGKIRDLDIGYNCPIPPLVGFLYGLSQPWLQEDGWEAKWEDICSAEVERWESK
ncbi:hypothetical protein Agabi119p4_3435 [Agaricus bisporus var. burnettii]|uniref:Uncharacterized protein n=1 Tax=Agaricus bisporus var. burnettii TaxID=192524 RepID=A0A8H7KIY6_AGABI|nr:hypothetical protein Agabi119p4_3435 [Agaricus bisporus var. burnettii]